MLKFLLIEENQVIYITKHILLIYGEKIFLLQELLIRKKIGYVLQRAKMEQHYIKERNILRL